MMPEMFVYEVVGGENNDSEHYDAEAGKENIHPSLVEKVYL